jgi:hypothetical protein
VELRCFRGVLGWNSLGWRKRELQTFGSGDRVLGSLLSQDKTSKAERIYRQKES